MTIDSLLAGLSVALIGCILMGEVQKILATGRRWDQLEAERDNLRIDLYTWQMTCPVCRQYGDGCCCGGVVELLLALEEIADTRGKSAEIAKVALKKARGVR